MGGLKLQKSAKKGGFLCGIFPALAVKLSCDFAMGQ
jgi:hypothetical protein